MQYSDVISSVQLLTRNTLLLLVSYNPYINLYPVRKAFIKRLEIESADKDFKYRESLTTVGGNVNLHSQYIQQYD